MPLLYRFRLRNGIILHRDGQVNMKFLHHAGLATVLAT